MHVSSKSGGLFRRSAAITVVVALAVAGCGDDTEGSSATSGVEAADESATTVAVADPSVVTEGDTGATGTRTVDSPTGAAEVPVDPQRLVVDPVVLDILIEIGFPVADRVVGGVYLADSPAYLAEAVDLDAIADVTAADFTWNVEQLLTLDPDLIIGTASNLDQGQLDQIKQVAPTLGFDTTSDWRAATLSVGDAVGYQDQAEAAIADIEARMSAFRERCADQIADLEVVVAEEFDSQFSIYQSGYGPGVDTLDELGITRTAASLALAQQDGISTISLEQVSVLDADILFFNTLYASPDLDDNPVWKSLAVVSEGRVAEISSPWGYGAIGAVGVVIDDVEAAFGCPA